VIHGAQKGAKRDRKRQRKREREREREREKQETRGVNGFVDQNGFGVMGRRIKL